MRRERTCLYPEDWPKREIEALKRATSRNGLFDAAPAADWSPDMLDRRIRSHGTFLHFALGCGQLKDEVSPALRASGQLLADFIKDLEGRAAPCTVAITLTGMTAMLRIIDPDGDRSQVEAAARYYTRIAKPSRDKRKILVGSSDLYEAGISRMLQFEKEATKDPIAAVASGDALMMMMLAANPVRLKNVVGTRIDVNLLRVASGSYEWRFGKTETKNKERIQAELPASSTIFIDRWLREIRPFLMQDNNHNALWVTTRGQPMSRSTVYLRFCNATEEELRVRINPHAVRHIAATSIAVSMPESVRMIPFILNNDDRTAQKHYNLADNLSASLQYLQSFERRRRQALKS
jgi:integrase/recombinase XerD